MSGASPFRPNVREIGRPILKALMRVASSVALRRAPASPLAGSRPVRSRAEQDVDHQFPSRPADADPAWPLLSQPKCNEAPGQGLVQTGAWSAIHTLQGRFLLSAEIVPVDRHGDVCPLV